MNWQALAQTLFGSEPYEDRTYWSALVHFAHTRASQGRPGGPALPVQGIHLARLIGFSEGEWPRSPGPQQQPHRADPERADPLGEATTERSEQDRNSIPGALAAA